MTSLHVHSFQQVSVHLETDDYRDVFHELLEKCNVPLYQWSDEYVSIGETGQEPFVRFYIEAEDTQQVEDFLHHARSLHLLLRSALQPVSFPDQETLTLAAFASWLRMKGEQGVGYDDDWFFTDPISRWLQEAYTVPYYMVQQTPQGITLEIWKHVPVAWMKRFTNMLKQAQTYEDVEVSGRVALAMVEEIARELGVDTSEPQVGPTVVDDVGNENV